MKPDEQAEKLNRVIQSANPAVYEMLSKRGKAIFFPKLGILSQSAEAAGKEINATIGIALEDDATPMRLPCVERNITLPPASAFTYAPSSGRADIRALWKEMLARKNPSLAGKPTSLPIVTQALTHGLSVCGYLFCDRGDRLIVPDLYWENYDLLFGNACGCRLNRFTTFVKKRFNLAGLRKKMLAGRPGKKILCLNFPNNPSGYTPTGDEAGNIASICLEAAEAGHRVVVLVDDSYFGLVFEAGVLQESIFTMLCGLHPNLLAVKIDGPTKEDYVWGFRVGFLTFGVRGGTPELYGALEAKAGGAIRGSISNCSNLSQSLLVKAWSSPDYEREKRLKFETLRARYMKVKAILAAHPEYREHFEPLPFNSGYFMCIRMKKADPESLRQKLLAEYSTGVILLSGVIRIAFSATPMDKLEKLFDNLYCAAKGLA